MVELPPGDEPLVLRSRKIPALIVPGIIFVLSFAPLFILAWAHSIRPQEPIWPGALIALVMPVLWGGYSIWQVSNALFINRFLTIASHGLIYTINQKAVIYPWTDLDRISSGAFGRNSIALQVRRKGQVLFDRKADLLIGDFGLSHEDLITLIEAGRRRWGPQ